MDLKVAGSSMAGQLSIFSPKVHFLNFFFSSYGNSMSTFQSVVSQLSKCLKFMTFREACFVIRV